MTYKYGRLWEFNKKTKKYYIFQILKLISITIDLLVLLTPQILFFVLYPISIYLLGIASFVWGFTYMNFCLIIFRTTLGNFVSKIGIVHKTGFMTKNIQYTIRSLFFGIYSLPIIGWSLLTVTLICEVFFKGISPSDFISQTIVISKRFEFKLKDFEENNWKENNVNKNLYIQNNN